MTTNGLWFAAPCLRFPQAKASRRAVRSRRPLRRVPRLRAALPALLNRLGSTAVDQQMAQSGNIKQPSLQEAMEASRRTGARLSGWFNRDDRSAGSASEAEKQATTGVYSSPAVPASFEVRPDGQDRPLIDVATILSSVWQLRKVVMALTVVGAIGGVLLAMSTPSVYVLGEQALRRSARGAADGFGPVQGKPGDRGNSCAGR